MPLENDRPHVHRVLPALPPALPVEGEELGLALAKGLDIPLAALRASMESLSDRLAPDLHAHGLLGGALREVERLGRNVRDLMDYVLPPAPMPLRCTASEIAHATVAGLPAEYRSRVLVAREHAEEPICIDAPLVARALRRPVENAFEAGSDDVLIVARNLGTSVSFRVIDGCRFGVDSSWARSAFHSTKRNHLGLGLALTERDLLLMDGKLELANSPEGGTIATLTIPLHDRENGEGAR